MTARPMRLVFIRHTPVNILDGICYGRSDVELAPDWSLHFESTREKIPPESSVADAIYSSPMRRCLDLANTFGDDVITDNRLMEMDFGRWELRRWDDVPEDEMAAWTSNIMDGSPPDGESLRQVYERCSAFYEALRSQDHQTAIVVTHGGVIRCMLARLFGMPVPNAFRVRIDYGSVTQARVTGEMIQIDFVNR